MISLQLEVEPVASHVEVSPTHLTVVLADGRTLIAPMSWYPRLEQGTPEERANWRLLGDGYAIEWPELDEHIGIEGLLAGRRSGESAESLGRWLKGRRVHPGNPGE